MICNCSLAGTSACKNCSNNQSAGNDYDYSKWFHVDIPPLVSQEQINEMCGNFWKKYIKEIPEAKELNCSNCKHYYKEIVNGVEFVNKNYCEKGVNVASPAFWCKWGEVND